MRKAEIKLNNITAGWLTQEDDGYHYIYDKAYLEDANAAAISLTLPLRNTVYLSKILFPFFGWINTRGLVTGYCPKELEIEPTRQDGAVIGLLRRLHRCSKHSPCKRG